VILNSGGQSLGNLEIRTSIYSDQCIWWIHSHLWGVAECPIQ